MHNAMLAKTALLRNAFVRPAVSCMAHEKQRRHITPKPHQNAVVTNAKASQAQRDHTARISRAAI